MWIQSPVKYIISAWRWTLRDRQGLKDGHCLGSPLSGSYPPELLLYLVPYMVTVWGNCSLEVWDAFWHYQDLGQKFSRDNWLVNCCSCSKDFSWGGAPSDHAPWAVGVETDGDGSLEVFILGVSIPP